MPHPYLPFYELLVYDTHLSAGTLISIIRSQQTFLNPKYQLKTQAILSFSVRKLNSTFYNGPVMRVRRDSDGQLADLYCDQDGFERALFLVSSASNLTTRHSIQQWIAGSRVYLQIWYDQTGRNMIQRQYLHEKQPLVHLMRLQGYPQIYFYEGSYLDNLVALVIHDFTFLIHADFSAPRYNYQRLLYLEVRKSA